MTRLWVVLIATLLLVTLASAQMPMPKPGPELKKLDMFTGNWNCEGQTQPGPMGPASKESSMVESKWMDGGFFVVMHSTYKGPMGDGKASHSSGTIRTIRNTPTTSSIARARRWYRRGPWTATTGPGLAT